MTVLSERSTGEIRRPRQTTEMPLYNPAHERARKIHVPVARPNPTARPDGTVVGEGQTVRQVPAPRRRPADPAETGTIIYPPTGVPASIAIYRDPPQPGAPAGPPVRIGCRSHQLGPEDLLPPSQPRPPRPLPPTPAPRPSVGQGASSVTWATEQVQELPTATQPERRGRHRAPSTGLLGWLRGAR